MELLPKQEKWMAFLSIILVLLISVIAIAYWRDIKNMSARQKRRKQEELKPVKETVNISKKDGQ